MNIVITGGSRGIGAACVRLFAARGDSVSFLYEKEHEAAQAVARETGARAICCDVASGQAVTRVFSEIGPVDVLVNNAGVCHYGLISQITPDAWRRLFAVNVDGAFYCIRAALPSMLEKQSGAIVNVSSMWGQVGASCEAAYSATKGALIALTKALAKELGPSHIRVNAVAPGVIQTDMCASVSPEVLELLREDTPVERLGTPEDIAQAVAYLADAPFVTGQVLGVSGGFVIT
ncbi:MAG: SDR family oxidoreductase [Oscillospiraceae bacterium]